jgi:endonuclease/exonuclease/phosphatase family metal-dependent hydrolase
MRPGLALLCLTLCVACGGGTADDEADAAPGGPDGPPADADPGPHPGEVWVMTWNIQLFPKSDLAAAKVQNILVASPYDLVAVQEIDDMTAFGQLDGALGAYTAVMANDPFGDTRVGLLYRHSTVMVSEVETLFPDDTYAFPRRPLKARVSAQGVDFTVVVVHLKATNDGDSELRRRDAVTKLDAWMQAQLAAGADEDIMVLGDWNDRLIDPPAENVFGPILDHPERYRFVNLPLAQMEAQGGGSYIPFDSFIDHILVTRDMDAEVGAAEVRLLKLDQADDAYQSSVSDHRPVLVKMRPQ